MRTLGQYALTRRLGAGGMGEVWMAQRTTMGAAKIVAIKTLLAERAHDPKSRKMFIDEARLSMLLSNSNIVQVFDADEAVDGTCYLAMEWVDGISLAQLFDRSVETAEQLPRTIVAFIIGEVLKGLAYAHRFEHGGEPLSIVHRDVSSHNVMLSISGEVKLMDFGIARMASEETSGEHVKGKLRYMPPEQLRGESRDPTIDLFAVGAILHELLDGRKFRGEVDEARLYGMIIEGEVPPLREPGSLPAELEALRAGLLAADPRARIPSARAAYRQLAAWSGYRDAKFELEELVRRFGRPEDSTSTAVLPPMHAAELVSTSRTRHRGFAGPSRSGTASTAIARRRPERPPSSRPRLLILGLSVASLGFGVFGVAAALHWRLDAQPESEPELVAQRDAAPVSPPEAERPVERAADPTPSPPPDTAPPSPPEPSADEVPAQPPKQPSVERERKSSKSTASKRIPVTIKAPGYKYWVEIRIAGKVHVIDLAKSSSTSTRLAPGSYPVSFREGATGSWRAAGTITLPKSGSATVVLRNGKASVE